MLYPQFNPFRQCIDLSGFWDFCFDPERVGEAQGWADGFDHGRPIAVPASWNDQFDDGRDYLGQSWYQTRFDMPWGWQDKRLLMRFGSVNYLAEVWLNGTRVGLHEGGEVDRRPFAVGRDRARNQVGEQRRLDLGEELLARQRLERRT